MKPFALGDRIVEPTYGLGCVIAVEDAYTRVQFDDGAVRKFLTRASKLAPADKDAPPPPGQKRSRARARSKVSSSRRS